MKSWQIKLESVKVEKRYNCEHSPYQRGERRYFFIGIFKFHTGSTVELVLTESRKEFRHLQTIDVTYTEEEKARKLAFSEYEFAVKALSDPAFAYARQNQYGCNLYKRDSESPSGVTSMGGVSSSRLIDFIKRGAPVLSPTEGLRSTGFMY